MGCEDQDLGVSTQRGILPRTLDFIFSELPPSTQMFVSFFEIYNERLFDLLGGPKKKPLDIREEKDGFFSVPELRREKVVTLGEAYDCL